MNRDPRPDPLIEGLAGLADDAPPRLLDRIAARWVRADSPVGAVFVAFTDRGVAYVRRDGPGVAEEFRRRFGRPLLRADSPPDGLAPALLGGGTAAPEVAVDLRGLTGFQADVLRAARTIPRGQVRPYAWVADLVGRPRAVRAVGTALATNPVPLVIPCHRVTRSDGTLGQYIFGADAKADLLREERAAAG
ncbi:methylated-DNA--[protein]-cysteine S-methyltransferase [Actinorugispora endophytica]|uniref:methylated-DNA--[protein]-cysteine S-methyltransferase n=1 Tax=Actinorugispora endophytica TaxID=1605990 RepID=A0A4R6UJ22_9ACTN|nr:MGMT family protein [Actinorugispora endophytica]TDQ46096.1 methylated-DNA-[protein]-cysteine S-methyltransferase [Actinorugispora endophytica]